MSIFTPAQSDSIPDPHEQSSVQNGKDSCCNSGSPDKTLSISASQYHSAKGEYKIEFGSRKTTLLLRSLHPVPLIVWITGQSDAAKLLQSCSRHSCRMFNLLIVEVTNWNDELSPWPCAKCIASDDVYAGHAGEFFDEIESKILPAVLERLPSSPLWIGLIGYSMAGLFALYASHLESSCFTRFASVSGSLWYPDFEDWYTSTPFFSMPHAVYLSLGTKESRTSNRFLSGTADRTEAIARFLCERKIPCVFEWNPCNHFQNPDARLASAITWLCRS